MTRYKEYIRSKGIKLEEDFEYLPFNGVEAVEPRIDEESSRIVVSVYHVSLGWSRTYIDKHGKVTWTCEVVDFKDEDDFFPADTERGTGLVSW